MQEAKGVRIRRLGGWKGPSSKAEVSCPWHKQLSHANCTQHKQKQLNSVITLERASFDSPFATAYLSCHISSVQVIPGVGLRVALRLGLLHNLTAHQNGCTCNGGKQRKNHVMSRRPLSQCPCKAHGAQLLQQEQSNSCMKLRARAATAATLARVRSAGFGVHSCKLTAALQLLSADPAQRSL